MYYIAIVEFSAGEHRFILEIYISQSVWEGHKMLVECASFIFKSPLTKKCVHGNI